MIQFDEFWSRYPRKNGRKIAERCWSKMLHSDQKQALEGLELWRRSVDWQDLQFCPYASTFLNQQRWKEMPLVVKLPLPDRGGTHSGGAIYSAADREWYERNGFKL